MPPKPFKMTPDPVNIPAGHGRFTRNTGGKPFQTASKPLQTSQVITFLRAFALVRCRPTYRHHGGRCWCLNMAWLRASLAVSLIRFSSFVALFFPISTYRHHAWSQRPLYNSQTASAATNNGPKSLPNRPHTVHGHPRAGGYTHSPHGTPQPA